MIQGGKSSRRKGVVMVGGVVVVDGTVEETILAARCSTGSCCLPLRSRKKASAVTSFPKLLWNAVPQLPSDLRITRLRCPHLTSGALSPTVQDLCTHVSSFKNHLPCNIFAAAEFISAACPSLPLVKVCADGIVSRSGDAIAISRNGAWRQGVGRM